MPTILNNRAIIIYFKNDFGEVNPALLLKDNAILPGHPSFSIGANGMPINNLYYNNSYIGSNGRLVDNGNGFTLGLNWQDYIILNPDIIKFNKTLDLTGKILKGLPVPTLDDHAATKKYVDDNAGGGIKITNYTHIIPNGDTNDVIDIFKDYFTDVNIQPNKTFDIDFFISMDSVAGSRQAAEKYTLVFKFDNNLSSDILGEGEYINDFLGRFGMLYRFKFFSDANTRVWYNREGSYKKDNLTISQLTTGGSTFVPKANIIAGNSFEVQQTTSKGQMTINATIKEY